MKTSLLLFAGAALVALQLTATPAVAAKKDCPTGTKWNYQIKKCVKVPRGSIGG